MYQANRARPWSNRGTSRRRLLTTVLGGSAAAAFIAACGGGGDGSSGDSPSGAAATSSGSGTTNEQVQRGGQLAIRRATNLAFWDPQRASGGLDPYITTLYAERLFKLTKGNLEPSLAESYEQTDNQTVTIRLRKDIQFTDGTPFNAEAVKYSFERGSQDKLAAPTRPTLSMISTIETPDQHTAVLRLARPNALFLTALPGHSMIISPTAHQKAGDDNFNQKPVGAGPFAIERIVQDGESTLVRNPNWPMKGPDGGALPYLDGVVVKIIQRPEVALAALQAGEFDLDVTIAHENVAALKGASGVTTMTVPSASWQALEFATNRSPVNNVALRKAINYAIDRDELNQQLAFGLGEPALGPLSGDSFVRDDSLPRYSFDAKKVQEFLAQAGAPNGLEITCATYNAAQAEAIQAQLDRQKIKLKVDALELAVYQDRFRAKGDYHTGTAGGPTVEDEMYSFYQTRYGSKGKYNPGEPTNAAWDAEVTKIETTYDLQERIKLYRELFRRDFDEAYRVWTITTPNIHGVRTSVKGLVAAYNPDLRLVWKSK